MKKVIKKHKLTKKNTDILFWQSKSPKQRIEAVEILRRQMHGNSERLQPIVRVIQQSWR